MKTEYLSEPEIERRTRKLLHRYFAALGMPVSIPVPIEGIVNFLDIPLRWDSLPDRNGELSVSKIVQPAFGRDCMIVMNEDLQETLFVQYPWLERTAMSHEIGHHQLHVRHNLRFQLPLALPDDDVLALPTRLNSLIDEDVSRAIRYKRELAGPSNEEWRREFQAHAYMRYLLMPEELLMPLLEGEGFLDWNGEGGIYQMANLLQVTPSALVVHLSRLGYIHVVNRRIHRGRFSGSTLPLAL